MNRIEYVAIYDVTNSNPNGDPDAANQPRMHDSGIGYITDVCIKRKLRNVAAADGQNLLIKSGENITEVMANGNVQDYWDAKMFGAVITVKGKSNLSVRGPVQFGFATSILPINPVQVCITTSVGRKDDQTQSMGNKWIVPHAVYRQSIFISPGLAEKAGVTEDDIAKLEQYLMVMLDNDKSAARAGMNLRGLYRIEHQSKIGFAPSWKTTESVKVIPLVSPSASWSDYQVTVADQYLDTGASIDFCPGVSITRLV